MNEARESVRKMLGRTLPDTMREDLNERYGLALEPGATHLDALIARLRQDVERGVPQAVELAKRYELI